MQPDGRNDELNQAWYQYCAQPDSTLTAGSFLRWLRSYCPDLMVGEHAALVTERVRAWFTVSGQTLAQLHPSEIQDTPLFRGVNLFDVEDVLSQCQIRRFDAGEIILEPPLQHSSFYVLLRGAVGIRLFAADAPLTAMIGPGEIVGELSAIDRKGASSYATAEVTCRLFEVTESAFWALLGRSPQIAENLMNIIAGRLRRNNALIETLQRDLVHAAALQTA
jgi:hypothetical protein